MSVDVRRLRISVVVIFIVAPVVFYVLGDGGRTGLLIGLAVALVLNCLSVCTYAILQRLDQLERKIARANKRQPGKQKGQVTLAHLRKERDHHAKRTQDIVNLFSMVPIRSGIPALGLWTASADLLVELVDRLVTERPAVAIEGGSGVSTVVMALAVREHGLPTKVIALEHNPEWAEHTRRMLERHGVADLAEVRVAPLAPTSLSDHETPWYDESAIADLSEIGLVLVDGPPEGTGPRARYPMVPLLKDKLAARCTILVDDTGRPGDADVVERWKPFLPEFEFEVLHLDKGASVLTRS